MKNDWEPSRRFREPAVPMEPVIDSAAWHPDDLSGTDAWVYRLTAAEISEIERAVLSVEARGLALMDITREAFPLPNLSGVLPDILAELMDGRGFAVIRGLTAEGRSLVQMATAFWGIGTYFGSAISQNGKGHMLGHVRDLGADYSKARGYMTKDELAFHSDRCDIASLCCLHPAKSGGTHRIASSAMTYNAMLKRRPDLARELIAPFYCSRHGEIPLGETEPWSRVPIFDFHEGYFTARGAGTPIFKAQELPGVPQLTASQHEALQCYRDMAIEFHIDVEFEAGDIGFVMNHVTIHSRTEYDEWPDEERKRHLLRLWLNNGSRPLCEANRKENAGVVLQDTVLQAPLEAA